MTKIVSCTTHLQVISGKSLFSGGKILKLLNSSYLQRYNAMITASQHASVQGTCE